MAGAVTDARAEACARDVGAAQAQPASADAHGSGHVRPWSERVGDGRGAARAHRRLNPDAPGHRAWAAREAVERLVRERPDASAKLVVNRGQARALLAGAIVCVAALILAPALLGGAFMSACVAGFAALIVFRAAALFTPPARPAPPGTSRADPPVYTVLVPLHRESEVVAELVAALDALDYPALWSKRTKASAAIGASIR